MSEEIKQNLLRFAQERGADKTYCPSEIARLLYPDCWRDKMDLVRKEADILVEAGELVVLQKGLIQQKLPSDLKGPIRLRKKKD